MTEPYESPSRVPTQWATAAPVPVGWMKQFRYFTEMYKLIENINGDIVECGVGEGSQGDTSSPGVHWHLYQRAT